MVESERIDYFRKIYKALNVLGENSPEEATKSIASLRLLLIDTVGEERQKDLIKQWNEEE